MSARLQQLADWLVASHLSVWLFVLLVGLAFAEAALLVGFVLPGETALLLGGVLCAAGVYPLPVFLVVAVLAAAVGDSTGYAIGHHFGPRIKQSGLGRKVGERRWRTAEAFVEDHGGKAVFLGRGQAFLRAMVPSLAGIIRMPYRQFLPWNVAGAVVWGGGVVLLGFVFGHSLQRLEQVLGGVGVLIGLGLVGLFVFWRRMSHRDTEPASQKSTSAPGSPTQSPTNEASLAAEAGTASPTDAGTLPRWGGDRDPGEHRAPGGSDPADPAPR